MKSHVGDEMDAIELLTCQLHWREVVRESRLGCRRNVRSLVDIAELCGFGFWIALVFYAAGDGGSPDAEGAVNDVDRGDLTPC